jgi:hypothetical protein
VDSSSVDESHNRSDKYSLRETANNIDLENISDNPKDRLIAKRKDIGGSDETSNSFDSLRQSVISRIVTSNNLDGRNLLEFTSNFVLLTKHVAKRLNVFTFPTETCTGLESLNISVILNLLDFDC